MKKVLSLDGGGIRGLIPALVLAAIENATGKSISESFDLIAGTSTGGILALGLVKDEGNGEPQYSATALAKLYEQRGKDIFSRSLWKGASSAGGLLDEKYSEDGLEEVLDEYFDNEPLGAALTNVLVTSYDIQNRAPHFFKSWHPDMRAVEMKFVGRATSAAPTYFEPALVPVQGTMRALIDGGVFVNNPVVSAYAEAKRIFPGEEEMLVVSIGTGELTRPIAYSDAKDWGKAGWMLPVLSCVFDGVSDAANYQMQQILNDGFVKFQTSLTIASDDMDNVTNGNIQNLKAEAKKLIRTHKQELERLVEALKT